MCQLALWLLLSNSLLSLFRSVHISPQSESSFDSALKDPMHIADSLDPESLELLWQVKFWSTYFRMVAFRFSSFSQSVFRILLILDTGRTVWISWAILGQPGLKLRWSPLINVVTGYENDGPLHYVAYEQWMAPFLFSSLVLTICTLGYHILQISSTILITLMCQELLITSNGWNILNMHAKHPGLW